MAQSLLQRIQGAISNSNFDPTTISSGFKSVLQEQLGLSSFSLTAVAKPSGISSFGGESGVLINGTYADKLLGSSLNKLSADQNIQLFFWGDATNPECVAFFQLNVSKWTLTQSFAAIDKSSYFQDLPANNPPLFALSTANLWKADCTKVVKGGYAKAAWIHPQLNFFFSSTETLAAEFTKLPQYQVIQNFIKNYLTGSLTFQFSGTINNAEKDFPIVNMMMEMGTLKSPLGSIKIPANALVLSAGLGTTKVPNSGETEQTAASDSLASNIFLYLTLPMPSNADVQKIQFKDLVSVYDMSLINISLTEGQNILLSDLITVFEDLAVDALTGQLPPSFSNSITDNVEILDFGFSLALKKASILNIHISLGIIDLPSGFKNLIPDVTFEASKVEPIIFYWNIEEPFGTKTWSTTLSGSLQFLDGPFYWQADYQKGDAAQKIDQILSLSGGLKEGSTVSLNKIEQQFGFDASDLSFIPNEIKEFAFAVSYDYSKPSDKTTFSSHLYIDHAKGTSPNTGIDFASISASNDEYDLAVGFFIGGNYAGISGSYNKPKKAWEIEGDAEVGTLDLQLQMNSEDGKDLITGSLSDKKGNSVIADIIELFNPDLDISVFSKELDITAVDFLFDPKSKSFGLGITDKTYGKFVLSTTTEATASSASGAAAKRLWFMGVEITKAIDFGGLPLVGKFIKDHGGLKLTPVQFELIPQTIPAKAISSFQIPKGYPELPAAEGDNAIPAEALIKLTVTVLGESHTLSLKTGKTLAKSTNKSSSVLALETPEAASSSGTESGKTASIGHSFGPVIIENFSANYANKRIELDITGGISLAGFTLALDGLGIGIPFPFDDGTDFEFKLHGLGVAINEGVLQVSGGFLEISEGNFMGEVSVQAAEFGMTAFGGYDTKMPSPSFFIFVNVNFPLGGPPYFFLNGLAGGFGINRAFKLPTTFEELNNYPLLPGSKNNPIPTPGDLGGGGKSAMDKLTQGLTALSKYIYPEQGNYWVAAGLDVSSFEMIQVEAVLSASFGVGLDIGLLGSANMTLPISAEPEPLAYIAINFVVAIEVEKGIFSAIGEITPTSFIYTGVVHITGGFAFDIWFKGAHAGDFVVSIGGYSPHFKKPAYYPSVPRLSMALALGAFAMKGQAYFAMTPKLLMAGMEVNANWHGGPVKAWFDVGADFILGWNPFFYEADAYIHMTGKVDLLFTVTIHAGADLAIWGPKFGGKADFDLSVISFTIHFGSEKKPPAPLKWKEFKKLIPNSYPTEQKAAASTLALSASAGVAQDSKWATTSIVPQKPIKQHSTKPLNLSDASISIIENLWKDPHLTHKISDANDIKSLEDNTTYNWVLDSNHFQINVLGGVPLTGFSFNEDQYNYKNANAPIINASAIDYVTDPIAFYANPPSVPPPSWYKARPKLAGKSTLVYNDGQKHANPWWSAPEDAQGWWQGAADVGIAPMDLKAGTYISKLSVELMKIEADDSLALVDESFVVKLITKSVTGALWGGNGAKVSNVNVAPVLIEDVLLGIEIMPPIWSPEQTKSINIYELIFQQNPRDTSLEAAPTPVTATFDKHDSKYEDEDDLILKETAFSNLSKSAAPDGLIGSFADEFAGLQISATATELATVGYEAAPLLSTLGATTSNSPS